MVITKKVKNLLRKGNNWEDDSVAAVSKDKKRRVVIEWIGEGWNGDYDEEDIHDEPLLRFDVQDKINGEWETLDNGSYCTAVNARLPKRFWKKMAEYIVRQVQGESYIKRICEDLSWINSDEIVQE